MWKSINNLTKADLAVTPIWELRGDSGSELVRPTSFISLTEYRGGPTHIAATRFIAAGGDTHYGYCSPADPSGLDYVQPVVLTPQGPFPLWHPGGLSEAHVAALCSALSVRPSNLFPLQIECLVPVDGILFTGCVDAA
jgi:hypothetical protein